MTSNRQKVRTAGPGRPPSVDCVCNASLSYLLFPFFARNTSASVLLTKVSLGLSSRAALKCDSASSAFPKRQK